MNVNPRISFPPEVDFVLISALIRDTCRVAFSMQTLDPPLDLAFASEGELYDDTKSVLCVVMCLVSVSRLHNVCSKQELGSRERFWGKVILFFWLVLMYFNYRPLKKICIMLHFPLIIIGYFLSLPADVTLNL